MKPITIQAQLALSAARGSMLILATGGMGEVYRARDMTLECVVNLQRRLRVLGLIFLAIAAAWECSAQERFLEPEFGFRVVSDIVYATGAVRSPEPGEIDLLLDLYLPTGDNVPTLSPGFVLIHGGGFTEGSKTGAMISFGRNYAQRGYVCTSINYRLVRDDPPTEDLAVTPSDPLSVTAAAARVDAARAVEWMRANAATYRIDPTRIAIGGYSAGAITALGVAYRDPGIQGTDVQVVLSLSGGLYGTEYIIDGDDPPLIMIHGTADPTVPFSLAQDIATRAFSVGLTLEFYPLEGVGHGTPFVLDTTIDGVRLSRRIMNFFYEHLRLEGLLPNGIPAVRWNTLE